VIQDVPCTNSHIYIFFHSMGRWTQFDEDPCRLPEGFIRIAYDSDTEVYTFRDGIGTLYEGAPGERYGVLRPINDAIGSTRPRAFDSDRRKGPLPVNPDRIPKTFHDMLPSNCITAPSSPVDGPPSAIRPSKLSDSSACTSMRVKFIEAARKTALPKMQGVVHNLRRSKTTASSFGHTSSEDAKRLLQRGFSTLTRSTSRASAFSSVSVEKSMSVSSPK